MKYKLNKRNKILIVIVSLLVLRLAWIVTSDMIEDMKIKKAEKLAYEHYQELKTLYDTDVIEAREVFPDTIQDIDVQILDMARIKTRKDIDCEEYEETSDFVFRVKILNGEFKTKETFIYYRRIENHDGIYEKVLDSNMMKRGESANEEGLYTKYYIAPFKIKIGDVTKIHMEDGEWFLSEDDEAKYLNI